MTRYRLTLFSRACCDLGLHRNLHVIQRFGAAAHVGCPRCEREFAMHDGLRAFVPWDGDLEQLYQDFGCDVNGQRQAWLANKHPVDPNVIGPQRGNRTLNADGSVRATA